MTKLFWASLVAAGLLLGSTASAQVPQIINYQGRVAVGSVNFDGVGQFRFALVDAAGTTTYWSNDGSSTAGSEPAAAVSLPVVKGLYAVLLGDSTLPNMTVLPPPALQYPDVRLRVWFDDGTNGSQLLAPDQRLAAVAYAVLASGVTDGAITAAKIAPGAVGAAQLGTSAVQAANVAGGQVVKSVNGLTDAVTLTAGPNVTLTPSGTTLIIAADDPLETWSGSQNVTTLGTVTTGSWQAAPIADGFVASAAAWNGKQAGNATLTLLSGKSTTGSGGIVLGTQPTLTNPIVTGAVGNFSIGNGNWWVHPVPYLRPTTTTGISFDLMPNGAPKDCWIDICSTDVMADPTNFEALNLTKRGTGNGAAYLGANFNGTGQPRDLMLQTQGGRVGIGTPFNGPNSFATSLLHLASAASTDLSLSSAGNGVFSGLRAYHSRGTPAVPLPSQSGDTLLFVGTRGWGGGTEFPQTSESGILFQATETFTTAAHGTKISIQTTTPGTVSRLERLGVDVDVTVATGDVVFGTLGKGLRYKAGANARAGNATLNGGNVTVANTGVTANTVIMLTRKTRAGAVGELGYTVNPGVGFTIDSASTGDGSVVSYQLLEAN